MFKFNNYRSKKVQNQPKKDQKADMLKLLELRRQFP